MKCRQCGKKIEKDNRICPHCGYVHDLQASEIPSELNHLSLRQIRKRINRQVKLKNNRWSIVVIVAFIILGFTSFTYFKSKKQVTQIPNFHDDLIEQKSSNALGNSVQNIVNGGLLLQYGNDVYASDKNGITKVSLSLNKKEIISNQPASYINSSQEGIYWINNIDNIVYSYDMTSSTISPLNIQASQMVSLGNYLYYLETSNTRAIYQYNKTTTETKKMTQSDCVEFKINGDWLYFTTDNAFYQTPVLGGEIMKIADQSFSHFMVDNQRIYYLDNVTDYIWSIKKDGSEKTLVVDSQCRCFLLSDQYLYYAINEGGLFKLNKETGEISVITKDIANQLHIAGTWIYYLTDTNEGRFVSIDENSETITPVDIISNN